jgi:FkbM family methyltransferase
MLKTLKTDYEKGNLKKYSYMQLMYMEHKKLYSYADYIKNTNCKKIEIENGEVIFTFLSEGMEIKMTSIPFDQTSVAFTHLDFGAYDKEETSLLCRLVHEGDVVLDIGANAGWYSLHWLKRGAEVFSFEPMPQNVNCLSRNIELNKIKKGFHIWNCGLSNTVGYADFCFDLERCGASGLKNIRESNNNQKISCPVETLDNIAPSLHFKKIDFIKCDVEGAEKLVIEGGLETIKKYKPIIYLELLRKWSAKFGYHPNEVIKILTDIGYHCDVAEITDETEQTNFLFVPEK